MADAAKKQRTIALRQYTRNLNHLDKLLDDASPAVLVTPHFEKFQGSWTKLEEAQDKFIELTDIDIEADKDGLDFLDEPSERYQQALIRYSTYLKTTEEAQRVQTREKEESDRQVEVESRKQREREAREEEERLRKQEQDVKFLVSKKELESAIDAFKRSTTNLRDSLEEAGDSDKRREWQKVESEFSELKIKLSQIIAIDPEQDISDLDKKLVDEAESVYASTQKWIVDESRDISLNTSGGSRTSATKKEAVTLPSFQGDEKTSPFLNFPIWKHKWDTLIVEYEPGYRTTILWEHLDAAAREKYAGCEKDYDKSMERLSKYYADPVRIVACINKEVNRQGSISDGDYCQLVSYGNVSERNYERL